MHAEDFTLNEVAELLKGIGMTEPQANRKIAVNNTLAPSVPTAERVQMATSTLTKKARHLVIQLRRARTSTRSTSLLKRWLRIFQRPRNLRLLPLILAALAS